LSVSHISNSTGPEDERLCAQGLHRDANVADHHAEVKAVAPLVPERLHWNAITDREMRAPSVGSRSRDGTAHHLSHHLMRDGV
jgi:hypothetical protein